MFFSMRLSSVRYPVHAIGFQTNYILPAKDLIFLFNFQPEYRATAGRQGRTIVLGLPYTFGIPKISEEPTKRAPATP